MEGKLKKNCLCFFSSSLLTGKSNIQRIGEIQKFDGKDMLSVWNGEDCNKIR